MNAIPEPLPVCPLCASERQSVEMLTGHAARGGVRAEIEQANPDWRPSDAICIHCLNRFRAAHVGRLLEQERGDLSALEQEVVKSLREQQAIAENPYVEFEEGLTLGERLSDRLARFGGSWTFLLIFGGFLAAWIVTNAVLLLERAFDPYPFILLNLVLSCLAAIQAPVILMSQNRQEAKDRLRAEHDYRVNLKAELEVRLLHAKLDQLLTHQWQRLLEIEQLQLDLMQDLAELGTQVRRPEKRLLDRGDSAE